MRGGGGDTIATSDDDDFHNFSFEFDWEFCIEKCWGFLVNFSGLRFPRNEARKLLKQFGENSEHSGQNSGRTFEKFGKKLSFSNFFLT